MNFLIFIFAFLSKVLTQNNQEHKILTLEVQENGQIDTDMELTYYKLTIPANVAINTTNLVIRVKENDQADSGTDDFSDPDIYASKVS
jgi:uncharacterized protein involved in tellurium resistance